MAINKKIDRSETIGCSDIAVIMGVSPYKTAVELWREKCRIVEAKNIDDLEHIEWGNRLESVILDKYEEKNETLIVRDEQFTHPSLSWFQGNLDGFDYSANKVIEAKTVSHNAAYQWGTPNSCQVPSWYNLQVQGYMELTNADVSDFCVLIAGQRYREYTVARSQSTIDQILEAITKFRWHVEKKTPPPPQNYKDILRLWKPEEKIALTVNSQQKENLPLIQRIEGMKALTADIKVLQDRLDTDKQSLLEIMSMHKASIIVNNGTKDAWVQKGRYGYHLQLGAEEKLKLN